MLRKTKSETLPHNQKLYVNKVRKISKIDWHPKTTQNKSSAGKETIKKSINDLKVASKRKENE